MDARRIRWLLTSVAIAVIASATVVSGRAWGCVPQPYVVLEPRASGAAGTTVSVVGQNFGPGATELRWNGIGGPLLTKATGASFSVPLVIPSATEGVYTLVALSRSPDGGISSAVPIAFQVTGSGPSQATRSTLFNESDRPSSALLAGGSAALLIGAVGVPFMVRRRRKAHLSRGSA